MTLRRQPSQCVNIEITAEIIKITIIDMPQAALGSWLDSESNYRLTVQKVQQAQDGADYASSQYEKYSTALQQAQQTLNTINSQNAAEKSGLIDERALIIEIMQMIGAPRRERRRGAKRGGRVARLLPSAALPGRKFAASAGPCT